MTDAPAQGGDQKQNTPRVNSDYELALEPSLVVEKT